MVKLKEYFFCWMLLPPIMGFLVGALCEAIFEDVVVVACCAGTAKVDILGAMAGFREAA